MPIESNDQLREIYPQPSGRAKVKALPALEEHSIEFIKRSPFFIMATSDKQFNMDASPRGGSPGFVHIKNKNEIIIPDAKGNNRVDSISNILETGRVGCLFLIPGMDETLRLNGSASLSSDPKILDLFSSEKIPPKAAIVVKVQEVFLHCAKAFMRSKLWDAEAQMTRSEMPTMGKMLNDQLGTTDPVESQEEMVNRYKRDL